MIEVEGMISVAEAAKRLNRSIEQVRRNLREGKLKGQRVGNQWFVLLEGLAQGESAEARKARLLQAFEAARTVRERIREESGTYDIDRLIAESREGR